MTKRILIDASNDQETRIASIQDDIIEDFEYEVVGKKQLRGNVYLARVSRVEPSLQAAFVEYGGNRQGFLAFSEIHPDYYRIPVEDRAKLLETVSKEVSDDDEIQVNSDENIEDESKLKVFATGGNINKIQDMTRTKSGKPISYLSIKNLYNNLLEKDITNRMIKYNLNPDRADVIIPALKIFISTMDWTNTNKLFVPKVGLVDGMISEIHNSISSVN